MNKNKSLNIFIYTIMGFCLILTLSTCRKKKDCKETGTCPPEYYKFGLGEAKDYLWAKAGSYWIYKNTKTGGLDTLTCTGIFLDTIVTKGSQNYSKNITIEYEKLYRGIRSSFNKWDESQSTDAFSADNNDPSEYNIVLARNTDVGLTECFFYPFNLGIHAGTGSHFTSYIGMDSTMILQGKIYHNVAKFDISLTPFEKDCQIYSPATYYWAKDVGLIKKDVKDCNYSWELIEYNIIK